MEKKENIIIRLSKEEKEKFQKKCEENDTTMSIQIRKYILQYISENKEA